MPDSFAREMVDQQAPLSMGFPKQEYLSGLPFLSPGDLLDSGIEPGLLTLQVDYLLSQPPGKPVVRKKNNAMKTTVIVIGISKEK